MNKYILKAFLYYQAVENHKDSIFMCVQCLEYVDTNIKAVKHCKQFPRHFQVQGQLANLDLNIGFQICMKSYKGLVNQPTVS